MTTLTTIEQILAEGLDPAYLVFALPEWEYFHPTELPAPIAHWIAKHCPEVEIRRISSIPSPGTSLLGLDQHHDEITSALKIAPVFMIAFNEEQAEAFAAAWRTPDGAASDQDKFYLCDVSSRADPGIRKYDAHGVYFVPNFPDVSQHNKDHPSE